jgi:methionyl-tRNA formyltransferase
VRLVLIATGDIALPSFRQLVTHGPRPLALVTQPDKPVGRHQVLTPPAIKSAALAAGIPVMQP